MAFATVMTTLPTSDGEHGRLMRNVSERDQQLYGYGRAGYRLAASVAVPGTEAVTVIDTLTREGELKDGNR
ncbi:MAG: hypothetical protein J0H70_08175 [Microbacterium chocolatum]|nr:hypothetical protein [Microbacterium chocolatum]